MRRASLVIRSTYAACLLGAGANHVRILIRHGLSWDYGGVAWPSAAYWTSLSLLDPLAALVLFVRPRVGIASTLVLIATNVLHNLAITMRRARPGELLDAAVSSPMLLSQVGFMMFVAATAPIAWKGASRRPGRSARPA